jgi:hypothetical protein
VVERRSRLSRPRLACTLRGLLKEHLECVREAMEDVLIVDEEHNHVAE